MEQIDQRHASREGPTVSRADDRKLDDHNLAEQAEWVPVDLLLPADSPRVEGEDIEHIRMLAESDEPFPPVIVHRATMRIIDGMHRFGAATLRGDEKIEVRFFDGTRQEAFILAVKANITHGRPLSFADRARAAERIIESHPTWSNRAIAAAAGLGARRVGEIRRRIEAESDIASETRARIGRDGRVRPVDNAEGRLRASEIIKNHPDASVRAVARSAGVSPTTALDVRNRLLRGDDPVPVTVRASMNRTPGPGPEPARAHHPEEPGVAAMLQSLRRDPSLRFTESGRALLRWILSRAIRPGEWRDMSHRVPTHCTFIVADVARRCADEWERVARDLERRADRIA